MSPGLTILAGNGQVIPQFYNTPVPLTVQAGDSAGRPIANLSLTWTVTSGQGTLVGAMLQTDANGQATALFRGDVLPGYSFSQQTVTVNASIGTVNFIETTTINRLPNGDTAAPPLVQLVNPPIENRKLSGASGTVLRGAVVVNVVQISGTQSGVPIPNVGVRMVNPEDPSGTPPAQCATPVLTDSMGNGTCDLLLTAQPGAYGLSAEVGEFVMSPVISLTITQAATCAFTASATNQQFTALGGVATIVVTTSTGCSWTAVSNATWITVTAGASGSGYGGATISVAANTGAARTGTVTVAGQTITINQAGPAPGGGAALAIVTQSLYPATIGVAYAASLAATGGTAPYRWSIGATLPPGLTLNPTSGAITGTAVTAGSHSLPVTVTDAAGATQSRTFNLSVVTSGGQPSPPSITNTSFPAGTTGTAYLQVLNSIGGCAGIFSAPPVYSLSAGTLPAGLLVALMDDNRRYAISGTPTQAGTFNFTITVTDSCGGSGSANFTIVISGANPNPGSLVINPPSLGFTTTAGANPSADQTVTITGPAGTTFSAAATSSGGWLSLIGAASGTLPATLTLRASTANGFSAGSYSGAVALITSAGNATIPVMVTASGPAAVLVPSITNLIVPVELGSSPISQTITVTNANGPATFTVLPSVVNGPGGWLAVGPLTATTPATLTVTLNPTGVGAATYTGAIQLMPTSPVGSPVAIQITFRVLPPAGLSASPLTLAFTSSPGQPPAAAQTVNIASTGVAIDATIAATTTFGGNWLFVTPNRQATPLTATVSVNPAGLPAGSYQGMIVISSGTQPVNPVNIPVTLTISQSAPVISSVVNAASYQAGPVSPGEIVTVFGSGMGPSALVTARVTTRGTLDSALAGTAVLFDGVAAPLVYSSTGQLSVIAPYALDGKASTQVQVSYQGLLSAPVTLAVAPSAPGIFTALSNGSGAAAALNQDGSYNTASSGAAPGSIVVIYATGEGQTNPGGVDGLLATAAYPKPLLPVTVTVGGVEAEVVYAGAAPTFTAGLMQINVRIPAGLAKGAAVPLVLKVGGGSSQAGVTIYTQP